MSRRTHRMSDLLRGALADLLLRRTHDPRLQKATVAAVDVSPDLRRATVHLSIIGEEAERLEALAAAQRAKGFLRSQLAHELRHLRAVPDLDFELDRGAEHSARISEILEELHVRDEGS